MTHFFVPFSFLFSSPSSVKQLHVFGHNAANSAIVFPPNSSFIYPITFLFLPLDNGLSNSQFEVSALVSTSFAMST